MNRGTGPQHEETGKRRQVFNQLTRNTITSPVLFCTPHDYLVNFLSQKKQVVVKIRSNKVMLIMMRSRFCLSCLDVMDNLLELLFSFSGRVVLNTNPSATIVFFSLSPNDWITGEKFSQSWPNNYYCSRFSSFHTQTLLLLHSRKSEPWHHWGRWCTW